MHDALIGATRENYVVSAATGGERGTGISANIKYERGMLIPSNSYGNKDYYYRRFISGHVPFPRKALSNRRRIKIATEIPRWEQRIR